MDSVAHREDEEDSLTSRQREIVKLVEGQGFATIEALARHFAVSAQTIRRDVIRLDRAQVLQRFHGGAGLPEDRVRLGHARKQTMRADAKERIARAVARLIPERASVFLDVGTSVEAVARALRESAPMHIFTNSLAAATVFAGDQRHDVFVTGGLLRGADGSLVGESATERFSRFRFDFAVIGCSGFDEDGAPMDFDVQKVAVKQAAISNARHAIIVADASKFVRHAVVRIASVSSFRTLVCDEEPPRRLADQLAHSRVGTVVA